MRRGISTGLVAGMLLLTAAVASGSPRASIASVRGGSGTLTLSGRVGSLQFDQSSEPDVIAIAGPPDATATGNFGAQEPDYFAMGYTCQEHEAQGWFYVDHFDYCRTIFYINTHTQLLTAFASSSRNYSFRGASPECRPDRPLGTFRFSRTMAASLASRCGSIIPMQPSSATSSEATRSWSEEASSSMADISRICSLRATDTP